MAHERARELVEDDQFAAPGSDGEALAAKQTVDLVAAQPGRVDELRAVSEPPPASTRNPPPGSRSTPVTLVPRRSSQPASTASVAKASGV